jgi:copper transport protein
VLGAALLGLMATAAAIVLEAATATGTSFWAALDLDAIDAVDDTRVVRAWVARLGVWLLIGVIAVVLLRPGRAPALRRAALGAVGTAPRSTLSRPQVLLVGGALVALALTAALAGHSATYSPGGLLVCTDTVHLLCVGAWLGGLAMLLLALPLAARPLPRRERTPLLAGVVGRFSLLAVVAVTLLLLAGIVQSIALVGALDAFVETAYGRLVLARSRSSARFSRSAPTTSGVCFRSSGRPRPAARSPDQRRPCCDARWPSRSAWPWSCSASPRSWSPPSRRPGDGRRRVAPGSTS